MKATSEDDDVNDWKKKKAKRFASHPPTGKLKDSKADGKRREMIAYPIIPVTTTIAIITCTAAAEWSFQHHQSREGERQ